jgi:uncharacterized protein involved in exopolysaccharide biosynthesis
MEPLDLERLPMLLTQAYKLEHDKRLAAEIQQAIGQLREDALRLQSRYDELRREYADLERQRDTDRIEALRLREFLRTVLRHTASYADALGIAWTVQDVQRAVSDALAEPYV